MFSSPSHYHATFSFAREWEKKDFRIVYIGTEKIRKLVEDEGFEFLLWNYTIEYYISSFKAFLGVLIKTVFDRKFTIHRYFDFYRNEKSIDALVNLVKPSHIFIDEHLSEYALFLKKNQNIDTHILCTKLSSRKSKNIPPMNSYFMPNYSMISIVFSELLWIKHWLAKWLSVVVKKIAFGFKDEEFLLRRYCKKYGFDKKSIIDEYNFFFTGIRGVDRIIMGTRMLEIPWREKKKNEYYYFSKIERNETKYITNEYNSLVQTIKANPDKKVIYCSFGTVGFKNIKRIEIFMNKLIEGFLSNNNMILILSTGKLNLSLSQKPNIYLFEYLPQLDFLKHCHLMITHGGHNSIKECIQANVKMLVYPHMEDNDQPGNAMRVELNNLGLRGNLENDSISDIWKKIYLILADKKSISNNLRQSNLMIEMRSYHLFF